MSATTNDLRIGITHQMRTVWRTSRAFVVAAIVVTVTLHLLAMLTAALHEEVVAAGVTPQSLVSLAAGMWAALALLPALGGGDSDDPMAVAAVGGGRSFTYGSRFAATMTDAGPGLFIPALALIGAAAQGWPGWLAGLALAWNGLACGQLARAGSAILVARIGPTLALATIAAFVLFAATILVSSGLGPGAWWQAATTDLTYFTLLLVSGAAALWAAWALNRPSEKSVRTARPIHLPKAPFAALVVVMATGVGRSIAARSTLVTAAIAPLLVRSAGAEATAGIVFFVMAAAAAVLGANGFAYDGGAAVWLLGKVNAWSLLVARVITTGAWVMGLAVIASFSGALGGTRMAITIVPYLLLVALATAASGLVPSVHRPAPTDFDSFRAQPAPVASSIGTLFRAVCLTMAVLTLPLWLGTVIVLAYCAVALVHARWELRDPVALASLA